MSEHPSLSEELDQLKDNHHLLLSLLNASADKIAYLSRIPGRSGRMHDFEVRFLNQRARRWYGELEGKALLDTRPDLREVARLAMITCETGQTQITELSFPTENGADRWFRCKTESLGAGVLVTVTNITEQRSAENRLAKELTDTRKLQEISSRLILEDDVGTLYGSILDTASWLMRSDMASMQVFVPEKNALKLLAWKGFHPESAAFWEWITPDSDASCATALKTSSRVIIGDIESCDSVRGTKALVHYRLSGIRAVQATPLISRDGKLIGMISTHWRQPFKPSEDSLNLLDVLARQAADLIERHRSLEQQRIAAETSAFLLKLNDVLRPISDPTRLQSEACRMLGEHLQVSRVTYADIENDIFITLPGYAHAVKPFSWSCGAPLFGKAILDSPLNEETIHVSDVSSDDRFSETELAMFRAFEVASFTGVLLRKHNKRVAVFGVHHSVPREWKTSETELIREVGARIQSAIERARAEEALRISEKKLRQTQARLDSALKSGLAGTFYWDVRSRRIITDENMKEYFSLSDEALTTGVMLEDAIPAIYAEDRENVLHTLAEAAEQTGVYVVEYRVVHSNGQLRWLSTRGISERDEKGRVTGVAGFAVDITQIKEAEETVRRSEQQLKEWNDSLERLVAERTEELRLQSDLVRSISETMPDVITIVRHPSREIDYSNRDLMELLDFDAHEIRTMSPKERRQLLHPEDLEALDDYYDRFTALGDQQINNFEYRVRNRQGELVWLRIRGKVFRRDRHGNVTHTLNIAQDITAQKEAEQMIREQKRFITEIAETIPDMISVMELPSRRITYINTHAFSWHGYSTAQMMETTPEERNKLVHPDDQEQLNRYFERFSELDKDAVNKLEYRARNLDSDWMWFRVRGRVFERHPDGSVKSCVNVVQNITDRKNAELEAAESKALLETVFNSTNNLITLQKPLYTKTGRIRDFEILMVNDVVLKLLNGRNPVGRRYSEFFPHVWETGMFDRFKAVMQTGKPDDFEQKLKENDAFTYSRIVVVKFGELLIVTSEDITQRKLAEQDRKRREEELLNLKLLQQKEILNAIIITQEAERERIGEALHNGVAQLLYGIKTRLQLLQPATEKEESLLKELLHITGETIDDTRRISFELVPVLLKDYGIEVALEALFRRIVPQEMAVQLELTGLKKRLPEKIEFAVYRIVQELVNNVIRHAAAKTVSVRIDLVRNDLRLCVADDGNGFDARKKKNYSGIGLQSVRTRAKLLNGSFDIRSGIGKGTTVTIVVPLADV